MIKHEFSLYDDKVEIKFFADGSAHYEFLVEFEKES